MNPSYVENGHDKLRGMSVAEALQRRHAEEVQFVERLSKEMGSVGRNEAIQNNFNQAVHSVKTLEDQIKKTGGKFVPLNVVRSDEPRNGTWKTPFYSFIYSSTACFFRYK